MKNQIWLVSPIFLFLIGTIFEDTRPLSMAEKPWTALEISTPKSLSLTKSRSACDNPPDLGPDMLLCVGESVTLDAGAGYDSYLWSPGGFTTQTINVTFSGLYSVQVTYDSGACIESDEVQVSYYDPIELGLMEGADSCPGGGQGTIEVLLFPPDEPVTYAWSTSDGSGLVMNAGNQSGLTPGTYTVTVTDSNSCDIMQSITLNATPDLESPSVTCPANMVRGTDTGQCSAVVSVPLPTADDNCGITGISNNRTAAPDASDTYPVGVTLVTYTVMDGAGLTADCQLTIEIIDDEAPGITCPDDLLVYTGVGSTSSFVTVPPADASDACGIQSVTNDQSGTANASGFYNLGITPVIFTATDVAGITANCAITIEVVETQPPMITCPADINQVVDPSSCAANVSVPLPLVSAVPGPATFTNDRTGTEDASGIYPLGPTVVVFTAMDEGGLSASCQTRVTIIDNEAPTITCPADQEVESTSLSASVSVPLPVVNDNCSVDSYTNNYTGGTDASGNYPAGITVVQYTVTDDAGLTANCSFTVTLREPQAPGIACPANINHFVDPGDCDAFVPVPLPVVSDNTATTSNNITPVSSASAIYPTGLTNVLFTATNAVGLSTSCQMTVTIIDNEAPTISCPPNIAQFTDPGVCTAQVDVAPAVVSDNCIIAGTTNNFTNSQDASAVYPLGITTVTFTTTDQTGLTATCQMTVTVTDNQTPTINCPNDLELESDVLPATVTIPLPTATDNCGIASTSNNFNGMPDASGNYPAGSTAVQFTATDLSGLSANCSFSVTIRQGMAPTINCPGSIVQAVDPGRCAALVNLPPAVAADDNGIAGISNNFTGSADASGTYPLGISTIIFTATATNGNQANCSTQVNIVDDEAPQFSNCPTGLTVDGLPGACAVVVNWPEPGISDNCTLGKVEQTHSPGALFTENTIVTYTATDDSGNTASCTFTVIVNLANDLTEITASICAGESYTFGDAVYTTTGHYLDTLTNAQGCDSIIQLDLSILEVPTAAISGPNTLCAPETISLSASPGAAYLWSNGATGNSIPVGQPGIYSVTVTDANGCNNSASRQIGAFCGELTTAFSMVADTACAPYLARFTDQTLGNVQSWFWDFGNGNFSYQQNPFTIYPDTGTYTVTLISANAGSSDTLRRQVHVYPHIQAAFSSFVPDDCAPLDLILTDRSSYTFGLVDYHWNFGDGQFGTGPDQWHQYTFFDTLNVGLAIRDRFGCVDSIHQQVIINGINNPTPAEAGERLSFCSDPQEIQLAASPAENSGIQGFWSQPATQSLAGIAIETPGEPNTTISSWPGAGTYQFFWSLSIGDCPAYSIDTVEVTINDAPVARDDGFYFFGQPLINLDLLANDRITDRQAIFLQFLSTPLTGSLTANTDGTYNFSFGTEAARDLSFDYEVCLLDCPDNCSSARVQIIAEKPQGPPPPLERPRNVLTPNGDGIGDRLDIPNFEFYAGPIALTIINRWGNILYDTRQYDNLWTGQSSNGQALPEGTYYYIIRAGVSRELELSGPITIIR